MSTSVTETLEDSTPQWYLDGKYDPEATTNDLSPEQLLNGLQNSLNTQGEGKGPIWTLEEAKTLLENRSTHPIHWRNQTKARGIHTVNSKTPLKDGWYLKTADDNDWTNHTKTRAITDGRISIGEWTPVDEKGDIEAHHRLTRFQSAQLVRLPDLSKMEVKTLTKEQEDMLEKTAGRFQMATYAINKEEPDEVYAMASTVWSTKALGKVKGVVMGTQDNFVEQAVVPGRPYICTPGGSLFTRDVLTAKDSVRLAFGSMLTQARKNMGFGSKKLPDSFFEDGRVTVDILHQDGVVKTVDSSRYTSLLFDFETKAEMMKMFDACMPDNHQAAFQTKLVGLKLADMAEWDEAIDEKDCVRDSDFARQMHDIKSVLRAHKRQPEKSLSTVFTEQLKDEVEGWEGPKDLASLKKDNYTQESFEQGRY